MGLAEVSPAVLKNSPTDSPEGKAVHAKKKPTTARGTDQNLCTGQNLFQPSEFQTARGPNQSVRFSTYISSEAAKTLERLYELDPELTVNNKVKFHSQILYLGRFDQPRQQAFFDFINQTLDRISDKKIRHIQVDGLLTLSRKFAEALPHFSASTDFSFFPEIAIGLYGKPKNFTEFTDHFAALTNTKDYPEFKVAIRCLTRHGIEINEAPELIAKGFKELFQLKIFQNLKDKKDVTELLRGTLVNDWPVFGSLLIFKDVLEISDDPDKTTRVCAQSAVLEKEPNYRFRFLSDVRQTPSATDFFSIGGTSTEELNLTVKFYERLKSESNPDPESVGTCAKKFFSLLEACRACSENKFAQIAPRFERELGSSSNLDNYLDVTLRNVLKAVDNRSARILIEKMANAGSEQEYRYALSVLREVHQADVPDNEPKKIRHLEGRFKQQMNILGQALDCFYTFQKARNLIPILEAESKSFSDGHPGLFANFAYQTCAKVEKLHCSEGCYPGGPGIQMSGFQLDSLFEVDSDAEDPIHRHLACDGWTTQGITNYLKAKVTSLGKILIFSVPGAENLKFNGEDYSVMFFADGEENIGGSQCFLLPTKLVDQKLQGSQYDFMDAPRNVKDLATESLFPEDWVIAAREQGMLLFDIGAATNIGGLSNARAVFQTEAELEKGLHGWQFEKLLGLNKLDPWGNLKKMELLKFPKLFDQHSDFHSDLMKIISGFSELLGISENRYTAWKKGAVPYNPSAEKNWLEDLPEQFQNLRVLFSAYRAHVYYQLQKDTATNDRESSVVFYNSNALHKGPIPNMHLDARTMKLTLGNEVIQLPTADPKSIIDPEEKIRELCFSERAIETWQLNVTPQLEGVMPVTDFN